MFSSAESNQQPDIEFGVGMSQDWNSAIAGREAANKALSQLNGKPKFLLIFSTIHYYYAEKDGIKILLQECRKLVSVETPLVGGTVAAFICPAGCYTRGVVVVAATGDDIDITSAYAKDLIGNPKRAAEKLASKIKAGLSGKNKVLFEFMPGPIEPSILNWEIVKKMARIIPPAILIKLTGVLFDLSVTVFKTGTNVEVSVLKYLQWYLPQFYIIGSSTIDDIKCLHHFQYFNDNLLTNSMVGLGLSTSYDINFQFKQQIIRTGKKFRIEKGSRNFCLTKIDGDFAVSKYIKEVGWFKNVGKMNVKDVNKVTFYFPFAFEEDGQLIEYATGFFFGENIYTNRPIQSDFSELCLTSAKKNIEDLTSIASNLKDKSPVFTLIISAVTIPGILGSKMHLMHKILKDNLKDNPFLLLVGIGIHGKEPFNNATLHDVSLKSLSICKK